MERVVLYGAGGRCQLFLKERGFNSSASLDGRAIVGLVDDEPALHFQVGLWPHRAGGNKAICRTSSSSIGSPASSSPPSCRRRRRQAVQELALKHGLRLSVWSFGERKLDGPSLQQSPVPALSQAPASPPPPRRVRRPNPAWQKVTSAARSLLYSIEPKLRGRHLAAVVGQASCLSVAAKKLPEILSNMVCQIWQAGSLLHHPAPFPLRNSS